MRKVDGGVVIMIRLHNTMTRKGEDFFPVGEHISLYNCGPTLHKQHTHIGNLRSYVFSDVLKRYLVYRNLNVTHVIKITDVDDHIIKQIGKKFQILRPFTDMHYEDFVEQLRDLNILVPDFFPRVTDHIAEIVNAIKILETNGYTYRVNDSIYFDISKVADYGNLAILENQAQSKINAKGRLNQKQDEKNNPNDFCVWKAWTPADGSIFWDTEIGKGRPGWHIECSVLSMKYLGETIDIHIGGTSHIFPHHTNEIAQSEAITGKQFVRYWVHHDYLLTYNRSMSKEDGNLVTLADIKEKGLDPLMLRIILLQVHHQQKLNFTFEKFDDAKQIADKFVHFLVDMDFITNIKANTININAIIQQCRKEFEAGMNNNINISEAFSALFRFISQINALAYQLNKNQAARIHKYILEIDSVFGFIDLMYSSYKQKMRVLLENPQIQKLIKQREIMRKRHNYEQADRFREQLIAQGLLIQDKSSSGFTMRLISKDQ